MPASGSSPSALLSPSSWRSSVGHMAAMPRCRPRCSTLICSRRSSPLLPSPTLPPCISSSSTAATTRRPCSTNASARGRKSARDLLAREVAARGDVALHAVDADMAVAVELARGEHRRRELGAVDDDVEALLEQADQVLAGVALHAGGIGVAGAELLLGHVAVIALELLLGAQLDAEVRHLALAALAVLAGTIFTLVHRGLGTTPDVLAHAAIELVLGAGALRHRNNLRASANNKTGPSETEEPIDTRSSPAARAGPPLHRGAGPFAKAAPLAESGAGVNPTSGSRSRCSACCAHSPRPARWRCRSAPTPPWYGRFFSALFL